MQAGGTGQDLDRPPVVVDREIGALVGIALVIASAASFGLTVLFFGFVVLAGLLLLLAGGLCLVSSRFRLVGRGLLTSAAVVLAGPLVYVGLALL
jgi:hypothetical protein